MSFACDPALIGLVPTSFAVTTVPATTAPTVATVAVDSVANTATVILSDTIPPGHWTCIIHLASRVRWCMGYLPGDVNSDRLVAVGDINRLIDCLNNAAVPACHGWQTDIDRSSVPFSPDILREIDLLNGASPYSVWLTESLPPCP